MKEADLGQSFENFIDRNSPMWGIRLKYPNGNVTLTIGKGTQGEWLTDNIIVNGISPQPPKNSEGQDCVSAKKVKI